MSLVTRRAARRGVLALGSAVALLLGWILVAGPAAGSVAAAGPRDRTDLAASTARAWPQVVGECGGLLPYDLATAPCSLTPVRVPGLAGVRAIAAGGMESGGFSLAHLQIGTLVAWGLNNFGQLGTTTSEMCPGSSEGTEVLLPCSSTPVPVQRASRVRAISAGDGHALALTVETAVHAWGLDDVAELGVEDTGQVCREFITPTAAARSHALVSGGRALPHIRFRGEGSGEGGALEAACSPVPLRISDLRLVRAISAGGYHNVALTATGVFTWGDNGFAQLGNGTYTTADDPAWGSPTPIPVALPGRVIAMDAGLLHTLVVTSDGNVYGWGSNDSGQLGADANQECLFQSFPTPCSTVPVQVAGLSGVRAVSAGSFHSLALRRDGTVWKWGDFDPVPQQVPGLNRIVALAAGTFHNLALRSDGSVYAWGENFAGQLGDGTTESRPVPVRVNGLPRIRAIAAALRHSMALAYDGSVWVWGSNSFGELGVQLNQEAVLLTHAAGLARSPRAQRP